MPSSTEIIRAMDEISDTVLSLSLSLDRCVVLNANGYCDISFGRFVQLSTLRNYVGIPTRTGSYIVAFFLLLIILDVRY